MNLNTLVIDQDVAFIELLTDYLSKEGFVISVADDGERAIKKALNQTFDIIVLDLNIPNKNGFEVLHTIRAHQHTPVLILTARNDDLDRILALEMGADDYLHKPCNPRELLARLHAILRRAHTPPPKHQTLQQQGIVLDTAKRSATQQGIALHLTNTEFNILEMLMRTPGQAFSKEELTEYALDRKHSAYDRSIDVHISHLRIKLGDHDPAAPLIKTIRGFGYVLHLENECPAPA